MSNSSRQPASELKKERDLLEKKLHAMHRRYDLQHIKIARIYNHPFRFLLSWVKHRIIKRDHIYEED